MGTTVSRGAWGHAPPGKFSSLRPYEITSGTICRSKSSLGLGNL